MLAKVDSILMAETAKEHQLNDLMARLSFVQQKFKQVSTGVVSGGWPGGMHSGFGMAPSPGPNVASGKAKQRKAANNNTKKAGKTTAAAQQNQNLRADAPEFVPKISTTGWSES